MRISWVAVAVLVCGSSLSLAWADEPAAPQPPKPASPQIKTGVFRITIGADGKPQLQQTPADKSDKEDKGAKGDKAQQTDPSAPAQPGQPVQPEVRVETLQFGKLIQLGPEGQTEVRDFQGSIPREILEKLPEELRQRLQKELKDSATTGAAAGAAAGSATATTTVKMFVAKDGKLEEVETDLGPAGGWQGSLPAGLQELLQKAGVTLPRPTEQPAAATPRRAKAKTRKRQQATEGATLEELNAKLDKLLNRLERLETEVQQLKAQ